jgi:hypothetical protein
MLVSFIFKKMTITELQDYAIFFINKTKLSNRRFEYHIKLASFDVLSKISVNMVNRVFDVFANSPNITKNHPDIKKLYNLGKIAA